MNEIAPNMQTAAELFASGELARAESVAMAYSQTQINDHTPLYLLGAIRFAQGNFADSVRYFEEALVIAPQHGELHNGLAAALVKTNDYSRAQKHYERALTLNPRHPAYIKGLFSLLVNHGKIIAAERLIVDALQSHAENATIRLMAADVALRLGRHAEAQAHTSYVLQNNPDNVAALIVASTIAYDAFDWTNARNTFLKVLSLAPESDIAALNLAHTCVALGDYERARELLLQTHAKKEDHDIEFILSLIELTSGNLSQGWRHFLARPARRFHSQILLEKLPDQVAGRLFTLVCDEGFGDILFFLRYVELLYRRGARLQIVAPARLAKLLHDLPFIERVATEENVDDAMPVIALGDLPFLLHNEAQSIVPTSIRLHSNRSAVNKLRQWLAQFGPPPYLGVTWAAGPNLNTPRHAWPAVYKKRIEPSIFGAALQGLPYTVIVLQRCAKEIDMTDFAEALGRPVENIAQISEDLPTLLNLLDALDEYVCVSNTNVHLLAALRRRPRILLNHPAEWRWGIGENSPWFPDLPLYRQSLVGDWQPALLRLRKDLVKSHEQSIEQRILTTV